MRIILDKPRRIWQCYLAQISHEHCVDCETLPDILLASRLAYTVSSTGENYGKDSAEWIYVCFIEKNRALVLGDFGF